MEWRGQPAVSALANCWAVVSALDTAAQTSQTADRTVQQTSAALQSVSALQLEAAANQSAAACGAVRQAAERASSALQGAGIQACMHWTFVAYCDIACFSAINILNINFYLDSICLCNIFQK